MVNPGTGMSSAEPPVLGGGELGLDAGGEFGWEAGLLGGLVVYERMEGPLGLTCWASLKNQ